MKYHQVVPYITLNLAVLFWGLSFVAIKIALESFSTFSLIFIRFSIAAVVFLVLLTLRGFPRFSRAEHRQIFLAAVFQPGLYFFFETTGLQRTLASKASLIIAMIPIVVLGLSIGLRRERATRLIVAGIGLSVVGVSLLVVGDVHFKWTFGGMMLGDLLIVGAVMAMAIYTVSFKHLMQTHSAVEVTGLQMCYGALLFAPAFGWEWPRLEWAAVSGRSLAALIGLTLFATIGAFLCFNFALARLSSSRTAIFLNCVPVVTAIGAWALLGERLSLLQMAGGGLVLASVYLTNLPTELQPDLRCFEAKNAHKPISPRM
jgi:drug/metabolite transporter (DMT)-like permease